MNKIEWGFIKYSSIIKKDIPALDYCYLTNTLLKMLLNSFFNENIQLLNGYPQLQKDCETLYSAGKISEWMQVLSLIGSIKNIINQ